MPLSLKTADLLTDCIVLQVADIIAVFPTKKDPQKGLFRVNFGQNNVSMPHFGAFCHCAKLTISKTSDPDVGFAVKLQILAQVHIKLQILALPLRQNCYSAVQIHNKPPFCAAVFYGSRYT